MHITRKRRKHTQMQRILFSILHAQPAALVAGPGTALSCAASPAFAGRGWREGSARVGAGMPKIRVHRGMETGQDRRERYRQRGRTVARP